MESWQGCGSALGPACLSFSSGVPGQMLTPVVNDTQEMEWHSLLLLKRNEPRSATRRPQGTPPGHLQAQSWAMRAPTRLPAEAIHSTCLEHTVVISGNSHLQWSGQGRKTTMIVSERYSRMIQIINVWGISYNGEACNNFCVVVNCSYELFILKCMP